MGENHSLGWEVILLLSSCSAHVTAERMMLWHSSEDIMLFLGYRNKFICSPIGFIKEIRVVTFLPNEICMKWLTLLETLLGYSAWLNPMPQWVGALQPRWWGRSTCPGSGAMLSIIGEGPALPWPEEAALDEGCRHGQVPGYSKLGISKPNFNKEYLFLSCQ